MIVSAQGTPGAGKTTALEEIASLSPSYVHVPEIVLPFPDSPDDDFFIENDLAKCAMAMEEGDGQTTYLLDRDFLSTIAFVNARDGQDSTSARRVSSAIDGHLNANRLVLPDLFLHFQLDFDTSVRRQNARNPACWADKEFMGAFESELTRTIGQYIIANNVRYEIIDGKRDRHLVLPSILKIMKEFAI